MSEGSTKTSLLISWTALDVGLLEALRPFKARARGRRLKELATLGAELERMGYKLATTAGGYQVLAPAAGLANFALAMDPPGRAGNPARPAYQDQTGPEPLPQAEVEPIGGASTVEPNDPPQVIPALDEDAASFASSFL